MDLQLVLSAADDYARAAAKAHAESLYGTSKSYTAECFRDENEARSKLHDLLAAAPAPAQVEQQAPNKWQPISTAPKDGTVIHGALVGSDVPQSIRYAAVKAGICRADAALTGPHLLMLCDDLAEAAREVPAGEPVAWRYIRRANGEVILDSIELSPWMPELLEDIRQHYDVEEIPLYAVPPDAFELLRIWQTWLGAGRESCSEYDKPLWDRIGAVLASKEPKHD